MLFNYTNEATSQEELFKALTERALSNSHSSWEFVRTFTEWCVLKRAKKGLAKVIYFYDAISDAVYREYCKQVLADKAEFEMLLAIKQYQVCKNFYAQELALVEDMLDEYDTYVGYGHFMDQVLFGRIRETWHLYDHRGECPFGK